MVTGRRVPDCPAAGCTAVQLVLLPWRAADASGGLSQRRQGAKMFWGRGMVTGRRVPGCLVSWGCGGQIISRRGAEAQRAAGWWLAAGYLTAEPRGVRRCGRRRVLLVRGPPARGLRAGKGTGTGRDTGEPKATRREVAARRRVSVRTACTRGSQVRAGESPPRRQLPAPLRLCESQIDSHHPAGSHVQAGESPPRRQLPLCASAPLREPNRQPPPRRQSWSKPASHHPAAPNILRLRALARAK